MAIFDELYDPNNPVGQDPRRRYSTPGLQAPSFRTADFQDGNGNGKDDRDEPQPTQTKSPFAFNQDSVLNILRNYSHTPEGLKQAFAENSDLAGVSSIGGSKGDKILDPSTGRLIDVIQAAGEGGKAWQWLDDPGGGQDFINPSMFMGSPFASGMPTDSGFFEQLMKQARAQAGLDRGQSDRDALLSLLGS